MGQVKRELKRSIAKLRLLERKGKATPVQLRTLEKLRRWLKDWEEKQASPQN